VPLFELQFDVREVGDYAARFRAEGDTEVLVMGRAANERGYYTLPEFRAVCRWKTPRSGPFVARNRAEDVELVTAIALGERTTEHDRMRALRQLLGVEWATASVLLHLSSPDRYPILDVRALHAFGIRGRQTFSYGFWFDYIDAFRDLVRRSGLDGRTVDRGLWRWSAEQDEPLS
jgi:hypothetical protein